MTAPGQLGTLAALAVALAAAPVAAQVDLGPARVTVVSYRDLPFRTVVRQQYDFSCGSAALATLLRHHYGRDVDERTIFEAMYAEGDQERIRQVGFSLLDMKSYLAAHGYTADGFRMTLDELAANGAPAIVMVDQGGYRHFVVLKGVEGDLVRVGDPALGLKTYSREAFSAMWNGVSFLIAHDGGAFNAASDWTPHAGAPRGDALPSSSLASLTQQLPPIYQVTARFSLDPFLR